MYIPDSKQLFKTLEDDDAQNSPQPIIQGATDIVKEQMSVREELVLLLKEYGMPKQNLERKVSL